MNTSSSRKKSSHIRHCPSPCFVSNVRAEAIELEQVPLDRADGASLVRSDPCCAVDVDARNAGFGDAETEIPGIARGTDQPRCVGSVEARIRGLDLAAAVGARILHVGAEDRRRRRQRAIDGVAENGAVSEAYRRARRRLDTGRGIVRDDRIHQAELRAGHGCAGGCRVARDDEIAERRFASANDSAAPDAPAWFSTRTERARAILSPGCAFVLSTSASSTLP